MDQSTWLPLETDWHAATNSGGENCVEVGRSSRHTGIRDTKNREGGVILVEHAAFTSFLNAVKRDQLG